MAPHISVIAERIGLCAARAATLAAPFVIFLALPPFYNGIWVQVEGAMPWLHGLAGLAALGCGLMAWAGDERAADALGHPLVLIAGAIFVLAVALLPAATLPALSLFGAPEHGFGALAYLDLAALTAATFVALAEPSWRRFILGGAAIAVAATFALDGLFRPSKGWAPFFFGDYLAFYAVFVFAILGTLARRARPLLIGAGFVLIALSVMSANKAAILAIAGALALLPAVARTTSRRTAALLCILYPVVVGTAVVVLAMIWRDEYRVALLDLRGWGPLPGLVSDSWASIWSRAMLVVVGAQTLIDDPWRLLVGLGWGHYNEALLANLPIVKGRLHELIGPSGVYWDAIRRSDFHSHNQYFEALLSGGVGGAALLLSYGVAMVWCAPADRRKLALFVVLILSVLQSFWFQMPHTLPVMALAVVVLTNGGYRIGGAANRRRGRFLAVGAFLSAGVLAIGGTAAGLASRDVRLALDEIQSGERLGAESKLAHRFSAGLGEIDDATLLQNAYGREIDRGTSALTAPHYDAVTTLLARIGPDETPASLKLGISTVNVLSGLVFTVPDFAARFDGIEADWGRRVESLMRRAPRRSDIAIPYFNYLLGNGREAEALDLANSILARQPDNAVALWFSGIVLLGNERTGPEGLDNLKRSLTQGIRDLMPVDPAIIKEIEN